jgi:hypothetical protein
MYREPSPRDDDASKSEKMNAQDMEAASRVDLESDFIYPPRRRFPWGGLISLGIVAFFIAALVMPEVGHPTPRSARLEQQRRQQLIEHSIQADQAATSSSTLDGLAAAGHSIP